MKVVDAHLHVWELERGDYGWLRPTDTVLYRDFTMQAAADAAGAEVEGVILVQAAPTVAETLYLLDIAERHPLVLGVVGWIDFESGTWPNELKTLAAGSRLVGIRPMIQDMADPAWILGEQFGPVLAALADADLVFDALVRADQLPGIARIADRHPGLKIVIDHAGKPQIGSAGDPVAWRDAIAACAARPNIACKLSGLLTECAPGCGDDALGPYVDQLLTLFGGQRLLWGSDWPVVTTAAGYAGWLAMAQREISRASGGCAATERAVFGGTARRIYRLPAARRMDP